jgi:hypothetical protein
MTSATFWLSRPNSLGDRALCDGETMMRRLLIGSIAATERLAAHAQFVAVNTPGQWMDVRNRIALSDLPDSSEPIARLNYAKAVCHVREGTVIGEQPKAGYLPCLKAQGFVFLPDSPAQIAAHKKAAEQAVSDAQMRASGYALSQALINIGQSLQPHGCHGMVMPAGNFNMQCN